MAEIRLLEERGHAVGADVVDAVEAAQRAGGTAVAVAWDGAARGVLVVADAIKPTSSEAISQFRRLGLRPVLLTGDNRAAAETVAAGVGIEPDAVIAEVLPADKVDAVKQLQAEGRVVAMVGDVSQRRRRRRPGRPRTGHGHRHRRRDRGQRPHPLVRGDLRVAADAIRLAGRT